MSLIVSSVSIYSSPLLSPSNSLKNLFWRGGGCSTLCWWGICYVPEHAVIETWVDFGQNRNRAWAYSSRNSGWWVGHRTRHVYGMCSNNLFWLAITTVATWAGDWREQDKKTDGTRSSLLWHISSLFWNVSGEQANRHDIAFATIARLPHACWCICDTCVVVVCTFWAFILNYATTPGGTACWATYRGLYHGCANIPSVNPLPHSQSTCFINHLIMAWQDKRLVILLTTTVRVAFTVAVPLHSLHLLCLFSLFYLPLLYISLRILMIVMIFPYYPTPFCCCCLPHVTTFGGRSTIHCVFAIPLPAFATLSIFIFVLPQFCRWWFDVTLSGRRYH